MPSEHKRHPLYQQIRALLQIRTLLRMKRVMLQVPNEALDDLTWQRDSPWNDRCVSCNEPRHSHAVQWHHGQHDFEPNMLTEHSLGFF